MAGAALSFFLCIFLQVSFTSNYDRYFILNPHNQSVVEGGTAAFTCHANFRVNCTAGEIIYWTRQPIDGDRNAPVEITTCETVNDQANAEKYLPSLNSIENLTIYTLEIVDVTSADSEEYYCVALTQTAVTTSGHAVLTVANETLCETPLVTQRRDLAVRSKGEFHCGIDAHPTAPTFRWFVKGAAGETVPIYTNGRFATSANRLIISPLITSDKASQVRCEVVYATGCEGRSSWHQILVLQTLSEFSLNFSISSGNLSRNTLKPTQTSRDPPRHTVTRTTQIVVATDAYQSGVWPVIGSILALVILGAIIVGTAVYLLKIRKHPVVRQPKACSKKRSEGFPTLRPSSSIPTTTRGNPVYFHTIKPESGGTEPESHLYSEVRLDDVRTQVHGASPVELGEHQSDRNRHESSKETIIWSRDKPNLTLHNIQEGAESPYLIPNKSNVAFTRGALNHNKQIMVTAYSPH